MAFTYSVMLDIEGRNVLVVGGGQIASRKIKRIVDSGANITVVSPDACDYVLNLSRDERISYEKRTFRVEEIVNYAPFLVFAATDSISLNKKIARYCSDNNILVNVITEPANGNFSVQAEIEKNSYAVSISTFGHGPGFSKAMREYLEPYLDERLDLAVDVYKEIRQWLFENVEDTDLRVTTMRQLTLERICSFIDEGTTNYDELLEKVKEWLSYSLD